MTQTGVSITDLLERHRQGDPSAMGELMTVLYQELRRIAGAHMKNQKPGHTLTPTALVHEAFMKLAGTDPRSIKDRAHFYALASQCMWQLLVDHARGKTAEKRGGGAIRLSLTLDGEVPGAGQDADAIDALALDAALKALQERDKRLFEVVVLRVLGGLTIDEVAEVQGASASTVTRDWRLARAWLARELLGAEAK